ncbi:radical SAM protein [Fusibacter sp. JL298sf-3]
MKRYSVIEQKNPREIVLLKSTPCAWGNCTFCDYIDDNETDVDAIVAFNRTLLHAVEGRYKKLEIINSGSCFELPAETLKDIQNVADAKEIDVLYFESHYRYRHRLDAFRNFFNAKIVFKCGVETFDSDFRTRVLNKGMPAHDPAQIAQFFSSVCLMVGIKGQTKAMIARDMELLQTHFDHGCVNVYTNNRTDIKADPELIQWFSEHFAHLETSPKIEILWHNTDFGVGGADV